MSCNKQRQNNDNNNSNNNNTHTLSISLNAAFIVSNDNDGYKPLHTAVSLRLRGTSIVSLTLSISLVHPREKLLE